MSWHRREARAGHVGSTSGCHPGQMKRQRPTRDNFPRSTVLHNCLGNLRNTVVGTIVRTACNPVFLISNWAAGLSMISQPDLPPTKNDCS